MHSDLKPLSACSEAMLLFAVSQCLCIGFRCILAEFKPSRPYFYQLLRRLASRVCLRTLIAVFPWAFLVRSTTQELFLCDRPALMLALGSLRAHPKVPFPGLRSPIWRFPVVL